MPAPPSTKQKTTNYNSMQAAKAKVGSTGGSTGGSTASRSRSPFSSVKSGEARPAVNRPSQNSMLSAKLANKDRKIVEGQVAKGKALGTGAGWGEVFSDPARFNLGGLKTFVGTKRAQGSLGLGGLPSSMLQQINRLQSDPDRPNAGKPLSLASAHRSDAYNTALYERDGQKPTKSQHSTELPGRFGAIDLGDISAKDMAGMITAGKRAGFARSGTYAKIPTMLHLDMKPSPTGGYGPSLSPEVAAARRAKVAPTNASKYLADNFQQKPESLKGPATRIAAPMSPFGAASAQAAVPKPQRKPSPTVPKPGATRSLRGVPAQGLTATSSTVNVVRPSVVGRNVFKPVLAAAAPAKAVGEKGPLHIEKLKNSFVNNMKSRFIGTKITEGLKSLGSTVAGYVGGEAPSASKKASPAKTRLGPDPSRIGPYGGKNTDEARQLKALVEAIVNPGGSSTSPFKFPPPGEIFPLS